MNQSVAQSAIQSAVQFDTFVIERTFAAPLARVYAAFADAQRKRRWFAEGAQHEVEQFAMQFEVGGREQARYRLGEATPFPGVALESEGVFLDIVPEARIVAGATMAIGGQRISASLHTFEFFEADDGMTRLRLIHLAAFFKGADGAEMRRAGWEQLLARLAAALGEE